MKIFFHYKGTQINSPLELVGVSPNLNTLHNWGLWHTKMITTTIKLVTAAPSWVVNTGKYLTWAAGKTAAQLQVKINPEAKYLWVSQQYLGLGNPPKYYQVRETVKYYPMVYGISSEILTFHKTKPEKTVSQNIFLRTNCFE